MFKLRLLLLTIVLTLLLALPALAQDDELTFEGELSNRNASEEFDLDLEAGDTVTIVAESEDFDTILTLFNEDGDDVAENDDRGDGTTNSEIVYTATEDGEYLIEVSRFGDSGSGEFVVTVIFGAVWDVSEAATFLFDGSGELTSDETEIEVGTELQAGDVVVITTLAVDAELDTTLRLLDPNGETVAENDDRGDGTFNSQIIYEVSADGIYTVVVSSFNQEGEGVFLLSIALDPNAKPPFDYTSVDGETVGEFSGEIDDNTETYELDLATGDIVFAYTDAENGLDTTLTLYAPDGEIVAFNDDGVDGTLNSLIVYTAPVDGTYTLEVAPFDDTQSGDFDLTVLLVDQSVAADIADRRDDILDLTGEEQVLDTDNFRIRYTTEGSDAVTGDYLEEAAATLEEMYDIQVNQIGWAAPPRNPDGLYDVYIADVLGREEGTLGYASPIEVIIDNPNTPERELRAGRAVLVIDNDYDSVDNPQAIMRATITHEFNHVIQFGYDVREPLDWLYESTATWTETVTVGDDQDATGYVENSFEYPEVCWATLEEPTDLQLAYGDWTFLQTLADLHGERAVVSLWENAREGEGIEVIENALAAFDMTVDELVLRWRVQNFALDYDLAPLFGVTVRLEDSIDDEGDWQPDVDGVQEWGANYFEFDLEGEYDISIDGDGDLQLWALLVNDDTVDAYLLGDGGELNTDDYDYAALMVFNPNAPDDLGSCDYAEYEITVEEARSADMDEPAFSYSADNFERP
ncbi:MAG: DVUA0089 family protein [Chloroflexota bacterium]|nr:DVUA0089 family protein [Chloroflexota bacterium]